jgi:DNA-binding GntR family transcriptional regulator
LNLTVPAGAGHTTKREYVYRALRAAIMRCELAPGQRLNIQSIARELGVSPIPVREALQTLQSEGLVETIPHVGSVVARIREDSVAEIFAVLEGLEATAARVAIERADSGELAVLKELLREIDGTLESGEYERWGELNAWLHVGLARVTGMPMLEEMTEKVFDRWRRVQRCFFGELPLQRIVRSQEEHHQILAAIRNRDVERAEDLVRQHNRGALEAYVEHISRARPVKPGAG